MLDAELKASHFHDQDLCILLHAAEDENQHDIVKKAVRKALQARMKKLKLKYDNEVRQKHFNLCFIYPLSSRA